MGKKDIKTSEGAQHLFPNLKSYSVNEILAAGGTTAFAEKIGKNPEDLVNRLKRLPKEAFLTNEEVEEALKMLKEDK
jgi:hypothetical protein